jgi:2-methylisocitrate lyase-like PEP mutase family enzyme
MLSIAARRADFRALHDEGYFLLPTASDIGSAKWLENPGYAGHATSNTSLA